MKTALLRKGAEGAQKMSNKKSKNVSKTVKQGLIVHTRDEYFKGAKDYRKPGYEKSAGNYRQAAVVDSNRKDQLALVKLTTSEKVIPLNEKGGFRAYILTQDENGRPIKVSGKFIPDSKGKKLPKEQVNKIKKESLSDPKTGKENKKRLRRLKGRK